MNFLEITDLLKDDRHHEIILICSQRLKELPSGESDETNRQSLEILSWMQHSQTQMGDYSAALITSDSAQTLSLKVDLDLYSRTSMVVKRVSLLAQLGREDDAAESLAALQRDCILEGNPGILGSAMVELLAELEPEAFHPILKSSYRHLSK